MFLSGSDFALPHHCVLPHSPKLGGLKKKKKCKVALILFLYKPCSEPSQENVDREGLVCFSDCVAWCFQSLICRVKNKLHREELRIGHWQKFLVAPAIRRIIWHHLCWDNSGWSFCILSTCKSNVMNNFSLLILESLAYFVYWHTVLICCFLALLCNRTKWKKQMKKNHTTNS